MFKFLTRVFTGMRHKTRIIQELKDDITVNINERRKEARSGDTDAVKHLEDLDKTIADQSIKMLRRANDKANPGTT